MNELLMARTARKLVDVCGAVRPRETVLILTDFVMDSSIADLLARATYAAGAFPHIMVIPPNSHDSREPAPLVAAAMRSADVLYTPVSVSITHTQAMKDANAAGARGVIMTDFSVDMMIRGGMEADFEAIAPECEALAAILDAGKMLEVRTAQGTRLTMVIAGRKGIAKTGIAGPNDFTTVPDIEATISPLEATAEGVFVCDASIPYLGIGRPDRPVTCVVEQGNVTSIEGGTAADTVRQSWQAQGDPNVYNVAELGIGLNPHCRPTGRMLEDEGIRGTCHVGVGTSITLGGHVRASSHYDFVMFAPTILVDGIPIVQSGNLSI